MAGRGASILIMRLVETILNPVNVRTLASVCVCVGLLLPAESVRAAEAEHTLRMATLAPRGSTWAKLLEKGAQQIEKVTEGRVKLRYYFGAQQGDDRDVVRKIRLGQLDGGAITGVGLGILTGDVRVLELPFMFDSVEEMDFVRDKMAPWLGKKFEDKGFMLLGWGDLGWIHLYGKRPVSSRAQTGDMKMWLWNDDPLQVEMYKRLGINGVPLGVPEVLSALQTGLIDGCHGPPLGAVALQWYTQVKYMSAEAEAYGQGGFVVRKEAWEKISEKDRAAIMATVAIQQKKLRTSVRRDNERAKGAMKKLGIEVVSAAPGLRKAAEVIAMKVWGDLVGKVYSKEALDLAKKYRAEYRARAGGG